MDSTPYIDKPTKLEGAENALRSAEDELAWTTHYLTDKIASIRRQVDALREQDRTDRLCQLLDWAGNDLERVAAAKAFISCEAHVMDIFHGVAHINDCDSLPYMHLDGPVKFTLEKKGEGMQRPWPLITIETTNEGILTQLSGGYLDGSLATAFRWATEKMLTK